MAFPYLSSFREALAGLKREGRYRVFADIMRQRGQYPRADFIRAQASGRSPCGAATTIWAWASIPRCWRRCMRRSMRRAPVPAARATSPAPRIIMWNWKQSSPICTARKRRCCSPPASSRTTRRSRRWRSCCLACIVFSDELNHASMIDGIRRGGMEKRVFRHNDMAHLEALLQTPIRRRPKLIAFECVYSMDGDIAPIDAICDLAREIRRADLSRRGPCASACTARAAPAWRSATASMHRIDIIEGTLAKAFGVMGGYIADDRRDGGLHPLVRAGLHLHHVAAAGDCRRRAGQHAAPEEQRRRARPAA